MSDLPPSSDNVSDQPPQPTQSDYNNASSGLEDQLAGQTTDQTSGGLPPTDSSDRSDAGAGAPSDASSGLEDQLSNHDNALANKALDVTNPAPTAEQIAHHAEMASDQASAEGTKEAAEAEAAKRSSEDHARDDAAIAHLEKQSAAEHDAAVDKATGLKL